MEIVTNKRSHVIWFTPSPPSNAELFDEWEQDSEHVWVLMQDRQWHLVRYLVVTEQTLDLQ